VNSLICNVIGKNPFTRAFKRSAILSQRLRIEERKWFESHLDDEHRTHRDGAIGQKQGVA